jgi:hypothetical protein
MAHPIQSYISSILSLTSLLQSIGIKLDADDIIDVLVFNLDKLWGSIANLLLACNKLIIKDAKGICRVWRDVVEVCW